MECARCLFNTKETDIVLDAEGVCNYCKLFDAMELEYPCDERGQANLDNMVSEIKQSKPTNSKYDCIVGVSGGCDSSYLLYYMVKKCGLNPLAVNFSNGWDTDIAKNNMANVCSSLGVDLEIYKVDNDEFIDILKSFLAAGVLDIDAATDIGLIATLYRYAEKHRLKYIIEGHSFRTEGVQPLNWAYVDGKYISDIQQKFGHKKMKTYPNLWMKDFIRWTAVKGIKRLRPLYWIDYDKAEARKILSEYGWSDYGGHHLENKWTAFNYTYYLPKRAGIDGRMNEVCSYVRRGILTKQQANGTLSQPIVYSEELLSEVISRLGITLEELQAYMDKDVVGWDSFKTYRPFFIKTKLFWFLLYKKGVVPKSFYYKYCKPRTISAKS